MDISLYNFSKSPPISASVDDSMVFIIILNSTCTGTFYGVVDVVGVLDFGTRTKYSPSLIYDSGSEM